MKRLKKVIALLVASAALLSAVACTGTTTATTAAATTAAAAASAKVGVAMPTKDLQRWNQDGANMKTSLEAAGYTVDLQYASNDIATQVSQVENMITGGCTV